jgi:hypothetical protein
VLSLSFKTRIGGTLQGGDLLRRMHIAKPAVPMVNVSFRGPRTWHITVRNGQGVTIADILDAIEIQPTESGDQWELTISNEKCVWVH